MISIISKSFLLYGTSRGYLLEGTSIFGWVRICVRYVTFFPESFTLRRSPFYHSANFYGLFFFFFLFFEFRFLRLKTSLVLAKFQLPGHKFWQKLYPRPFFSYQPKIICVLSTPMFSHPSVCASFPMFPPPHSPRDFTLACTL